MAMPRAGDVREPTTEEAHDRPARAGLADRDQAVRYLARHGRCALLPDGLSARRSRCGRSRPAAANTARPTALAVPELGRVHGALRCAERARQLADVETAGRGG